MLDEILEALDSSDQEHVRFTIPGPDGEPVEYEVLVTFEDEFTGKNYVLYTDHSTDENGTRIFAGSFEPDDENSLLMPVNTDEEWEMIQDVLDQIQSGGDWLED